MTKLEAEKLFKEQIAGFKRYFNVSGIKLVIHDRYCTPGCVEFRDVAWADQNKRTVNMVRRSINFSRNAVIALMRHEIAHLCDPFVNSPGKEQRADDIAELVFGDKIKYSGPYLLQTIGDGEYPRPSILHQ